VNSIIEKVGSNGSVSGLNSGVCLSLGWDPDDPDFLCGSHLLQGEFWNNTLKKVMAASLQILFAAASVDHTNIQRHIVQACCGQG
jgi:hypothetical protein